MRQALWLLVAALAFIAAVEAVEDIDGRATPTWTANTLFEQGAYMREASRRDYTDALDALRRAVLDLP